MSSKFGPTAYAHLACMHILWGPVMNLAVILALYSYRRYAIIIHAILGLGVGIFSLAVSLNILIYRGLLVSTASLYDHFTIGIFTMVCIIVQLLLGFAVKLLNIFNFSSSVIMKISYAHKIFGYLVMILCKIEYLVVFRLRGKMNQYWTYLGMDMGIVVIIILRKWIFPKLEQYPVSKLIQDDYTAVESLKQLDQSKSYIIFGNYIYDINDLKMVHPVGMQIIQSVKNKDVDRYLYGMYSSESLPEIDAYSHSFRSIKLLDNPVAKLTIRPAFGGINDDAKVAVDSYACLSPESQLYEIKLRCLVGRVQFEGYKDASQLGRYRSLTMNGSVTRLYTNVYFALSSNLSVMEQIFQGQLSYQSEHLKTKMTELKEISMEYVSQNSSVRGDNMITLVFKSYPDGKLTKNLVDKMINQKSVELSLSCEKGLGLELKQLGPGKVIIVAGGTGILPFSDIIDLLFKQAYTHEHPSFMKRFYEISPILASPFLEQNTFQLFASFASLEDIHKLTLLQLIYLNNRSRKFQVTLKLRQPQSQEMQKNLGFRFATGRFQELVGKELGADLAKVWVCGPPKMNEGMLSFLSGEIGQSQILIM